MTALEKNLLMALVVATAFAACGGEAGDDARGEDPSPKAAPGTPTTALSPRISAVRHAGGWRVTVSVRIEESPETWVRTIRLVAGKHELGHIEREGPGERAAGEPLPVQARFDLIGDVSAFEVLVVDNHGRTARGQWQSS